MKMLMVYYGPYPHIGGLSTHMELVGRGLKNLGNEVDYLSLSSFPRFIQILFFTGPRYFLDKIWNGLGNFYFLYICNILFGLVLFYKAHYKSYDLISAQDISSSVTAGFIKKIFHIPVILTVHTYYTFEMISSGFLKKNSLIEKLSLNYEKKAYDLASHIITVDSRLCDYLISLNIPQDKINIILNPVDIDNFSPKDSKTSYRELFNLPDDKYIILCPRRLVEKNGVIYPLLACTYLKEHMDNFVLVYAGDGPERSNIEKLSRSNNLEGNILLLGSVNHECINKLYNASDVVVIPSVHIDGLEEATSISALESMASGVPVIASNIGGLKDIIKNGFNGVLVPERNEKELAIAIYELIKNKDMYEYISHNSIKDIENNFSYISRAEHFVRFASKVTKENI